MEPVRRNRILAFGAAVGLLLALLLVLNTFFGPQSRAHQSAQLRAEAEERIREGRTDEAIEKLRLAIKLNPNDEEAKRRYDELVPPRR